MARTVSPAGCAWRALTGFLILLAGVVESPADVVGETILVVTEGEARSELPLRNLTTLLSAPRTTSSRGQRTTLRLEVSGLEGLPKPIPIQVRNETPAVVRIEGGDTQTITVEPADHSAPHLHRLPPGGAAAT